MTVRCSHGATLARMKLRELKRFGFDRGGHEMSYGGLRCEGPAGSLFIWVRVA